jgi:hypothetical protein
MSMKIDLKFHDLRADQKEEMAILFFIRNRVKRVNIKPNVKLILEATYPKEDYSDNDDFFLKYAGKPAIVMLDDRKTNTWCILDDNNIILTEQCFE